MTVEIGERGARGRSTRQRDRLRPVPPRPIVDIVKTLKDYRVDARIAWVREDDRFIDRRRVRRNDIGTLIRDRAPSDRETPGRSRNVHAHVRAETALRHGIRASAEQA